MPVLHMDVETGEMNPAFPLSKMAENKSPKDMD